MKYENVQVMKCRDNSTCPRQKQWFNANLRKENIGL